MTIMSIIGLLVLLVVVLGIIGTAALAIMSRGSAAQALAARALQLQSMGVTEIYLLYGGKGAYMPSLPLSVPSVWSVLGTGFLAYMVPGMLIVEFAWAGQTRPFFKLTPGMPVQKTVIYIRGQKLPALRLGSHNYTAVGVGLVTTEAVQEGLALRDPTRAIAYTTTLAGALSSYGFTPID